MYIIIKKIIENFAKYNNVKYDNLYFFLSQHLFLLKKQFSRSHKIYFFNRKIKMFIVLKKVFNVKKEI